MSQEKKELSTLDLINQELEQKTAEFQGLATKFQEAQKFVRDNQANLISLEGAVKQLQDLKAKIERQSSADNPKPNPDKEEDKSNN